MKGDGHTHTHTHIFSWYSGISSHSFGHSYCIYFCDVCGLPKKASEIFEALIISDVDKAAISVIMMFSNCNYS